MGTAYLFGSGNKNPQEINSQKASQIVQELFSVDIISRDEEWTSSFLKYAPYAHFTLLPGADVELHGDGFPYLQLTPMTGEEEKIICIAQELEHLLQQGVGVSIKTDRQIEWTFTYGDLINLRVYGSFADPDHVFSKETDHLQIRPDEQILMGQPSEQILPQILRNQLREFLTYSGVKSPKVMLIAKDYEDEEKASQNLIFNIYPDQFKNEEDFQNLMRAIAWFLPKYYSFFGMNEESIENGFESL